MNYQKIFNFSIIIGLFILLPFYVDGKTTDSVNVNLEVTGTCNSNNICESDLNETVQSCPQDCGCNNNGSCESDRGENEQNCPNDCVVVNNQVAPGGGINLVIYKINNISVNNITSNSADISWATSKPSICQLFWGKTSDYEKETISETDYILNHASQLNNLDYQSKYHFKISCSDSGQEKNQTQDQQFQTLNSVSNVINFTATPEDGKIILSWTNSSAINFSLVKILRKEDFYPLNINDGKIIYEGTGNYFEDNSVINGKPYYYTIFTEDNNKNYSSGSIVAAVPNKKSEVKVEPVLPVNPVNPINPLIKKITINDFQFSSDGAIIPVKNNLIEIGAGKSLNISADCTKFSGIKTVLVTLQDKEKTYSFILNLGNQNSACDVLFMTPSKAGMYPLKISIINNENKVINEINTELKVLEKKQTQNWFLIIYTLIGLIIIFFVVFIAIKIIKK